MKAPRMVEKSGNKVVPGELSPQFVREKVDALVQSLNDDGIGLKWDGVGDGARVVDLGRLEEFVEYLDERMCLENFGELWFFPTLAVELANRSRGGLRDGCDPPSEDELKREFGKVSAAVGLEYLDFPGEGDLDPFLEELGERIGELCGEEAKELKSFARKLQRRLARNLPSVKAGPAGLISRTIVYHDFETR
ncbi:MAG: hypothetical protein ACTSU5_17820 [Promethearchaeota archaeon]